MFKFFRPKEHTPDSQELNIEENHKEDQKTSVETEIEKGQKQKIIEAIKSENSEELLSILQEVNKSLTNKEQSDFLPRDAEILKEKLDNFFQEFKKDSTASIVLYLGDSGLSRLNLAIIKDKIIVELGSNSTKEAKEKWEQIC